MTTTFKSAGAVSAATDREPHAEPRPVRPPLEPACTECEGIDSDCRHCGGTGFEPQPCGPQCECWRPVPYIVPGPGDWGTCDNDEDDEDKHYFQVGEFSMWKERLL